MAVLQFAPAWASPWWLQRVYPLLMASRVPRLLLNPRLGLVQRPRTWLPQ